jgi:hypothetical protein
MSRVIVFGVIFIMSCRTVPKAGREMSDGGAGYASDCGVRYGNTPTAEVTADGGLQECVGVGREQLGD